MEEAFLITCTNIFFPVCSKERTAVMDEMGME